ncbi:MAG: hypothetical protein A3I86_01580 [Candidatus Zambryskibacteria bacterium RIFCSPLOWO2_02_FULL_39_14]|uniref:HD domain-containing protein n=1 Tax=Candidatus Zambryskibacteria bacterium RIFCSPLOWO2_02_FULL_39_14 TaxID=1802769 RepID=A0A1G2UIX1_9BACT|nr:MAG: hypothetical protein A3I86_01580 [Candidatus Zambryskibacteria bacterium RIFCSPLOWO2_02_FULL_39_14]
MKPNYHTIEQMLDMIDEPNRSACFRILADNRKLFQTVQGSTNNHQNWPGGYFDHVQEIMNIAVVLYERLSSIRPLPFSLSDLLLVVYLHDVEKPWKYELRDDGQLHHKATMQNKEDHQRFRMAKLTEYGVVFTPEQENGMKYAEGELNDYSNRRRIMGPLACAAHMCDVASARLWFDHPMQENDPWLGARRIRD